MKILITGVLGLIGNNLSRALLKRGYEVFGIDNSLIRKSKDLHPDVILYRFDVSDYFPFGYISFPQKIDVIVHLAAGKIPLQPGEAEKFLYSNTKSTMNIIAYAKRCNAKVIFASTGDIYGLQDEFSEESNSILGPPRIARWSYAINKLWAEHAFHASDIRFNIIRYFGGYGPYQSLERIAAPPQALFISQIYNGRPITIHGDGLQTRAFCYIDDMVDGTIRVIEHADDRETFNIGNPYEEVTIIDLATHIKALMGNGHLPLTLNTKPSPLEYQDILARKPNIEKARTLLGYEPKIDLTEGLLRTINWQVEEMKNGNKKE